MSRQRPPEPPRRVSHDAAEYDHGLRRRAIVQGILDGVCDGTYVAGQRLVVQRLAERLGVSPTPVREALVELAGIGIVDLHPNRGAVVRHVTRRDVCELFQIRRALECEAIRSACKRADRAVLEKLVEDLRALVAMPAGPELVAPTRSVDTRLHDLIATSCGSRRLASEMSHYKLLFRAFRDLGYGWLQREGTYERFACENREHAAIVEAMLAGDRAAAVRAMSRHIRAAIRYWSRAVPSRASMSPPAAQQTKNAPCSAAPLASLSVHASASSSLPAR